MTMDPREALQLLRDSLNVDQTNPSDFGPCRRAFQTKLGEDGVAKFKLLIAEAEHEVSTHSEEQRAKWDGELIVLEGLDGVGKTTITNELLTRLSSEIVTSDKQETRSWGKSVRSLKTPPSDLLAFREFFDGQETQAVRRAFYTLGNILASKEIRLSDQQSVIVLDRFWSSTYAYQVAKDASNGDDKVMSASIDGDSGEIAKIKWPWYLVEPTVLVLIVIDEETRLRRLYGRNETITSEEIQLKQQQRFREHVLQLYRSMPKIVEVENKDGAALESILRTLDDRLAQRHSGVL